MKLTLTRILSDDHRCLLSKVRVLASRICAVGVPLTMSATSVFSFEGFTYVSSILSSLDSPVSISMIYTSE